MRFPHTDKFDPLKIEDGVVVLVDLIEHYESKTLLLRFSNLYCTYAHDNDALGSFRSTTMNKNHS